jgi:hypothetical protein
MHHLDGVVATIADLLAHIDGRDGNVHAVAVAALVKLLAGLERPKSRIGQQGILRSVRRQRPSRYFDADGLDREQHGKGLLDVVVEAVLNDLVDVDGVGLAQDVELVRQAPGPVGAGSGIASFMHCHRNASDPS